MNITKAGQAEILRSMQKDEQICDKLSDHVSDLTYSFGGNRRWIKSRQWRESLGNVLYYGFTTVAGFQTLGEEYTGIIQLDSTGRRTPGKLLRLTLVLIHCGGELIIVDILKKLEDYVKKPSNVTHLTPEAQALLLSYISTLRSLIPYVHRLHKAVFYLNGNYYHIAKRITGIKYVLVRRWLKADISDKGFKILGTVSLFYLLMLSIQAAVTYWKDRTLGIPLTVQDTDKKSSSISESKLRCALCLEDRKDTSVTPCGHLFCWTCILEWVRTQQICPLCREKVSTVTSAEPSESAFDVWRQSFHKQSVSHYEAVSRAETEDASRQPLQRTSVTEVLIFHLTQRQTKILASLVPDEIIRIVDGGVTERKPFLGVLLFGDISGFTALCEKYNNTGKGGTHCLSSTLNDYIGTLMEVIYSRGGDVLKFSGDEFLAVWKVKPSNKLPRVIHQVIQCALHIQKTLGNCQTDVNVILKVKLAISAGRMMLAVIGDEKSKHYLMMGSPVEDVKLAEHVCVSGDVTLSPSAWGHCSESKYEYSYKDEQHVKVLRILDSSVLSTKEKKNDIQPYLEIIEHDKKEEEEKEVNVVELQSTWRCAIEEAIEKKLGNALRPFIIPPVIHRVDADLPLKFLTELQQVTTMFVNVVPKKIRSDNLIKMVDEAYCIICSLLRKSEGILNKVTMFDKDIMFLVVFGESAMALKCADSIHKSVSLLNGVQQVSIGITTGMAYCGVLGHSLRAEYAVLGASVNKAARILCAYPGKISCDQNTFLHSKLPILFFHLLTSTELKGIGNVGAIYEYSQERRKFSETIEGSKMFPLLGRQEEMSLFRLMLETASESGRQHRGLIIEGDLRVGKSRLLQEVIHESLCRGFTPITMALSSYHSSTPYAVVHHIVRQALGLDEGASAQDKEERLILLLHSGESNITMDDLCYLNSIMQVRFPLSTRFKSQFPHNRKFTLLSIFQEIMRLCSLNMVITIDDVQYIDQESWELLKTVLNEKSTVLVMTVDRGNKSQGVKDILDTDKLLRLKLHCLDSQYLAPLACQILNVKAIPQELDAILQKRSNGNPGWCEGFIISLLQSGGITVVEVSQDDIRNMILVVPHKSFTEMSSVFGSLDSSHEVAGIHTDSLEFPVCMVTDDFNSYENLISQHIDAMIIHVFDCLSPHEQFVLKCASVLGNSFTRVMLMTLMDHPTPHHIAKAIKHLFEIHILGCATKEACGFSDLQNYVFQKYGTGFISCSHPVTCNCLPFCCDFRKGCEEMPKYANCRLMQFNISRFRTVTYNLMPGNQKKELHSKAIEFLENEAHKCDCCGGGGFIVPPLIKDIATTESKEDTTESPIEKSASLSAVISGQIFPVVRNSREVISGLSAETSAVSFPKETESEELQPNMCLPHVKKVTRSGTYLSIEKIHPKVDFRNCECNLIMTGVYQELIEHCKVAGFRGKNTHYLTEYGAAAISVGHHYLARKLLLEAEALNMAQADENDVDQSKRSREYNLGKIHVLLGQAHLHLGEMKTSRRHLMIGLNYFGDSFWTVRAATKPQIMIQLSWQWLHQHLPALFMGRVPADKIIWYNEVAAGLSHLSKLYMMEDNWELAKYTSLKSLNFAQASNSNFVELCAAYCNALRVCEHYGELGYCKLLDRMALITCKAKFKGTDARELLLLGELYSAIFTSRLLRGEMESAVRVGFRTLRIGSRVYANNVRMQVYPLLIQAAFFTGRMGEAADLLRELTFTSEEDLDSSASAWFYALCLDMLLDTGFVLEKTDACLYYCDQLAGEVPTLTRIVVRDVDARSRLVVSAWLWCLRTGNRLHAMKWKPKAEDYMDLKKDDTFCRIFSALKYLEGVLISMMYNLNKKFLGRSVQYRSICSRLFKNLDQISRTAEVFRPRYLHLKAYKSMIKHRKYKAIAELREARSLAEKHGNKMEVAWTMHNEEVWTTANTPFHNFWWEHSTDKQNLDWHEFKFDQWSNVMYSLPISISSSLF